MITYISSFGVEIIFDFSSYLANEIYSGLVGIAKGKVENTFGHYSILMHMLIFNGVTYFGKEMVLNREQEGQTLLVQLWSANMTGEAKNASFVRFDRYFSSKLDHMP